MFGLFSKKMTELSNHYIDFSRVGELVQANHHYSKKEIITRTKIIATGVFLGASGAYLNNKEKTNCSNLTMGLLMGTVGLMLSHGVVMSFLIKKRRKMSSKCDQLILEINNRTNYLIKCHFIDSLIKEKVAYIIDQICKHSLSNQKHARASQTWGKRITLLSHVRDTLEADPLEIENFWADDVNILMLKFFNDELFNEKNALDSSRKKI